MEWKALTLVKQHFHLVFLMVNEIVFYELQQVLSVFVAEVQRIINWSMITIAYVPYQLDML